MVGDISERSFENAIEQELLRHGQDAPAGGGLVGAKLSPYGDVPGAIAVAGPTNELSISGRSVRLLDRNRRHRTEACYLCSRRSSLPWL